MLLDVAEGDRELPQQVVHIMCRQVATGRHNGAVWGRLAITERQEPWQTRKVLEDVDLK